MVLGVEQSSSGGRLAAAGVPSLRCRSPRAPAVATRQVEVMRFPPGLAQKQQGTSHVEFDVVGMRRDGEGDFGAGHYGTESKGICGMQLRSRVFTLATCVA